MASLSPHRNYLLAAEPLKIDPKFMMELSCGHAIPYYGNPFNLLDEENLHDIMSSLAVENGYVGYYYSGCHVMARVLRFTGAIEVSGNPQVNVSENDSAK